jgi:thymidylate synthase
MYEERMKPYHDLLEHILEHGEDVNDRTGVGTRSVFGYQMRFDLSAGFPAITTKKLAWKAVVGELCWFLEGSTDERRLAELTYGKHRTELVGKSTIWTANADSQGKALGYVNNEFTKELGPVYGAQWRKFNGIANGDWGADQIRWILNQLRTNPDSRRIILSAWNPMVLDEQALPPCHYAAQFRVINGKLNCMLNMRSNDVFLGAPFNIASYALLIYIFARETGLAVGELIYSIGDAHIYLNHVDQVKEQLLRNEYPLPKLKIDEDFDLLYGLENQFEIDTVNKFHLENYLHHPAIKGKMAV